MEMKATTMGDEILSITIEPVSEARTHAKWSREFRVKAEAAVLAAAYAGEDVVPALLDYVKKVNDERERFDRYYERVGVTPL